MLLFMTFAVTAFTDETMPSVKDYIKQANLQRKTALKAERELKGGHHQHTGTEPRETRKNHQKKTDEPVKQVMVLRSFGIEDLIPSEADTLNETREPGRLP